MIVTPFGSATPISVYRCVLVAHISYLYNLVTLDAIIRLYLLQPIGV